MTYTYEIMIRTDPRIDERYKGPFLREILFFHLWSFRNEEHWKSLQLDKVLSYPKEVIDYLLLLQRGAEL